MKLEDKLMNRIIEGKSDLEEVISKNGTNVEIGGNLEVDGKLKVNSGFEVLHSYEFRVGLNNRKLILKTFFEVPYGNISFYFIGTVDSLMSYGIVNYSENGDFLFIEYYFCEDGTGLVGYVERPNDSDTDVTPLNADTDYLSSDNKLYRHDIIGKISDTESVSFTWLVSPEHSNNYNTPIDSLTDLVNLVLVGKYTASGTINGKQVIQVIKTSNTASGLKCLCVDGTEVTFNPTTVTDDVELLQ